MVTRANTKLIFLIFVVMISSIANAQIHGLWETTSVKVGDEIMTPIAKWSNLHQDGIFTSGNGWLQNSDGNWEYDEETHELTMTALTGFDDTFGAFKVEMINDDEITWTRVENGETVIVTNKRILMKPKHPATLAVGLWVVKEATFGGQIKTTEFVETEFHAVFLKWDNEVQEINGEVRRSGIWRVPGHKSVIDILYYDGSKPLQYWDLDFDGEESMKWTRGGIQITFERLSSFPED